MKTKHKISIITFAILVVGIVMYITIPFLKFERIYVFREFVTPDGMAFDEIPCYGDGGKKHTFNIKFNWDNSISISDNKKETILKIDSVDFQPTLAYGAVFMGDRRFAFEPYASDEFFEGISFYDTQQKNDSIPYSITLYRQQESLTNGPQRYAFELYLNNNHLSTGNKDNGHFFEY